MPSVSLELPDELKETFITVNNDIITNTPNISTPILIKNATNDVPYGILKGGNKPTYRQWNRTQKNYQPPSNTLATNAPISERESRLNLLKQKLKQQTTIISQPPMQPISPQIKEIDNVTSVVPKDDKPNKDDKTNKDDDNEAIDDLIDSLN